jgi:chromate reductase
MTSLSMPGLRLLVIAGSARSGSLNQQLAQAAGRLAGLAGAEVQTLDLRALQLPLYDGDLEARSGVPEGASRLRDAICDAQALLLVTPEYNGFPTPLLVNAFDWLSRLQPAGERPSGLAATASKPVALLSASPGPLGGLRSMNFLRQYLQMAFAMLVVPQQFALGRANDAFDAQGALKDERAQAGVSSVLAALGTLAAALHAGR